MTAEHATYFLFIFYAALTHLQVALSFTLLLFFVLHKKTTKLVLINRFLHTHTASGVYLSVIEREQTDLFLMLCAHTKLVQSGLNIEIFILLFAFTSRHFNFFFSLF